MIRCSECHALLVEGQPCPGCLMASGLAPAGDQGIRRAPLTLGLTGLALVVGLSVLAFGVLIQGGAAENDQLPVEKSAAADLASPKDAACGTSLFGNLPAELVYIAPDARIGTLTEEQRACLVHLREGEHGEQISKILVADAYGSAKTERWEALSRQHLAEYPDPDIAYALTRHLYRASEYEDVVRWSDVALQGLSSTGAEPDPREVALRVKRRVAFEALYGADDARTTEERASVAALGAQGEAACDNLVMMEQLAGLGRLSVGQRACLEGALTGPDREKVSKILIDDAYGSAETDRWEMLVTAHLLEVPDPDLAYKLTLAVDRRGSHEALLRWSEIALEGRESWGSKGEAREKTLREKRYDAFEAVYGAGDARTVQEGAAVAELEAVVEPAQAERAVTCDVLVNMEAKASLGRLSDDERACLKEALGGADREQISKILILDAFGSGETQRWEAQMTRHLSEYRDPDLAYKLTLHVSKNRAHEAVLRWSEIALEGAESWGEVGAKRVKTLREKRLMAFEALYGKEDARTVEARALLE